MNKRERVIAAFHGQETDHVPVSMFQHVRKEFWDSDDAFAAEQARWFRNTDVDFMKLSMDKYFGWPSPILKGITRAEDLYRIEPLGENHPYIRGQIDRTKKRLWTPSTASAWGCTRCLCPCPPSAWPSAIR